VDGDATESTETTDPTDHADPEPERLSVEQLCDYVGRASFATTLGRRGYQQGEVDALLVKVAETLRAGEPIADLVRRTHLTTVRLEDGYDPSQVDDFLAAVVNLDPHAQAAVRPDVGRSGLVTKLFG
jgi:DivIVA domain-containing protein